MTRKFNIIDLNLELYSLIGNYFSLVETNLSENMIRQIQQIHNEVYNKVRISIDNKNINEIIFDYYRNEFLLENQLSNYFFTLKGKVSGQIDISNVYKNDSDEYELKENYSFNESQIINLKEGDILSKIIAYNIIQKKENDETIKKISEKIKYQKYASLYSIFPLKYGNENIFKIICFIKDVNYNYKNNYKKIYLVNHFQMKIMI